MAPNPTPARLRPLNVGEAVDVGVEIYRGRVRAMVGSAAVVVLPYCVLTVLVLMSVLPGQESDYRPSDGAIWATFAVLSLGLLMTTPLVTATCAPLVLARYLEGDALTVRTTLRRAARHLVGGFVLAALTALLVLTGAALCFLPAPILWVLWSMATPAMIAEDLGPIAALQRGLRLIRGRYWRTFAGLLGVFSVVIGVAAITFVAATLLSFSVRTNAFTVVVVAALAVGAVLVVWEPLLAAVTVVFYVDARVRAEGFDIAWAAELLDRHAAAPTDEHDPTRPPTPPDAATTAGAPTAPPAVARPWGTPEVAP